MKFNKLDLLNHPIPAWALFLTLDNAGEHTPAMDALEHAVFVDTDALDARKLDPVGYHACDALACLDDEIDDGSRDTGRMPCDNPEFFMSLHD